MSECGVAGAALHVACSRDCLARIHFGCHTSFFLLHGPVASSQAWAPGQPVPPGRVIRSAAPLTPCAMHTLPDHFRLLQAWTRPMHSCAPSATEAWAPFGTSAACTSTGEGCGAAQLPCCCMRCARDFPRTSVMQYAMCRFVTPSTRGLACVCLLVRIATLKCHQSTLSPCLTSQALCGAGAAALPVPHLRPGGRDEHGAREAWFFFCCCCRCCRRHLAPSIAWRRLLLLLLLLLLVLLCCCCCFCWCCRWWWCVSLCVC